MRRLHPVLADAVALLVHRSRVALCDGVALPRRSKIPAQCLPRVSRHALAELVVPTDLKLGGSIPEIGRFQEDGDRGRIVFGAVELCALLEERLSPLPVFIDRFRP